MDSILKAGGDFLQKKLHLNRPGGQGEHSDGPDLDAAARHAAADRGDEEGGLFGMALHHIKNTNASEPINEHEATRAHEEAYAKGNASSMDAKSIGTAAALQAMKMFTSGSGSAGASSHSSSGGDMQSKMIGMAMSEAAKLFESTGGQAAGGKTDAVSSAGATMLKLIVQSKLKGAGAMGGSDSGGLSGLMGMASKFL
ncbi:hypothetical protein BT69DRAFT_362826 [Atractiella rhizophila]|nr:hypothetical protein BT69DRAFT_362826 [Atractiella rhizophila]